MSSGGRVGTAGPPSVRPGRSRRLICSHGSAVSQVEEVGMPASHLRLELVGHLVGGELAQLLGQDQLQGQVEQQVAQLVPDRTRVAVAERLVQLEHLLDQVGAQGLPGLGPVPGAPLAQVPHHRHRASKRRIVLHLSSVHGIIPAGS